MGNEIIDEYNSLQLENIIALTSKNIDRSHLSSVYHLGSVNDRRNVLNKIENWIKNGNHLCLSLIRKDSPFSFNRLDNEGIVESVEIFYEIYLMRSSSKIFHYCVIRVKVFPPKSGLTRELVLVQQVKSFLFKLYFNKRQLIYKRIDL